MDTQIVNIIHTWRLHNMPSEGHAINGQSHFRIIKL